MFKKPIHLFSKKIKSLEGSVKSSSYLGKKVFSKFGQYVGRVYDVVLEKGFMVGVMIKGKKRLFIGVEFFDSQFDKGIMLSIDPVTLIIGKKVYDSVGKLVGKVVDVDRNTASNTFHALIVKKGLFFKPFIIPASDVVESKHNVLLNKSFGENEE